MLDPRSLYTLNSDLWAPVRASQPALLHLLDGYIDAGGVTQGTSRYLLDECEHEILAEFDHDQLHDYRSRRPQMTFDTDQWVDLNDFQLAIHRLTDTNGKTFLLFTGPEPDNQWNRATAAVLGLAAELEVSRLITVSGIPMAVPHTRPTLVTSHATRPETVSGNPMWIDRVQIPGSFSQVLEYRAGQAGMLAQGFVAHVPHYLAQTSFPQATLAVLDRAAESAGLSLPIAALAERSAENLATIAAETAEDAEFPAVVAALEEQYDRLRQSGATAVPSAEEIGAAVEQFLAEQDPPQGDFGRSDTPNSR